MSSDNVTDDAATHDEHQQSQDSKSPHDHAVSLLKEKAAAGADYVNNPLSRKDAEALANELNAKHGTGIKAGVIYKAKDTIRGGKMAEIKQVVGENLGGQVKKPGDIFNSGSTMKVEDLLANDGGSKGGGSGQQATTTPGQQTKKEFEPLPIEQVKTIVDVCVDGAADVLGTTLQKPLAPKSVNAAKATYNATLEAYNASMPKWLLLPICAVVTFFVFVLPARSAIAGKVGGNKGKSKIPPQQDAAPAIQETVQEIQRTNDPFFSQR